MSLGQSGYFGGTWWLCPDPSPPSSHKDFISCPQNRKREAGRPSSSGANGITTACTHPISTTATTSDLWGTQKMEPETPAYPRYSGTSPAHKQAPSQGLSRLGPSVLMDGNTQACASWQMIFWGEQRPVGPPGISPRGSLLLYHRSHTETPGPQKDEKSQ